MNKTIYIPALSNGALNTIFEKNINHKKTNKSFQFYNMSENNLFNYPYILFSAHYNLKKNVEEVYNLDLKKTFVLGDSGGYQIATGILDYSTDIREKIFRWLENNTTYAINLDIPPFVTGNNKIVGHFDDRLKTSIENFKYFAKNQTGKTQFLNVLHGRQIKMIQKWYDQVKCFTDDFTGGWAIGGVAISSYNILLSIAFLLQNREFEKLNERFKKTGVEQLIHILGLSKPKDIIYLMYLVKQLKKINIENISITYDSSTPQTAGVRGNYIYSYTAESFKWLKYTNQIKFEKDFNYDAKMPCSCPVCQTLTLKDLYTPSIHRQDALGPLYYGYICLHNLYKILDYKFNIQKIINTNSQLIYKSIFSVKILSTFKIIDKIIAAPDDAINIILRNKKYLKSQDDQIHNINSLNDLF